MMGDLSENFSRWEFACRCGCGFQTVDVELVNCLQSLRTHFGKPVAINSGCRCKKHNANTPGASKNSPHRRGWAADFTVEDVSPDLVGDYLEARYSMRYGIGRYSDWTHLDMRRTKHRWDKRL